MAKAKYTPAAESTKRDDVPWFQYLLSFDPAGAEKEIFDHTAFRAHLRRHWGNRPSVAAKRRNTAAGQARVRSGSCAGATEVARTETAVAGRASP